MSCGHVLVVCPQNPTQDAVVDPVRGVTKVESSTPGHKVAMRPREQVRAVEVLQALWNLLGVCMVG